MRHLLNKPVLVRPSLAGRVVLYLVLFALLVFMTVRTSPLMTGAGSQAHQQNYHPKQRHLTPSHATIPLPRMAQLTFDFHPRYEVRVPCNPIYDDCLLDGRYFALPPPA